jgi:putative selenate reductase
VRIPDAAFGHDLAWSDAVPMFRRLREAAATRGLTFGLKLSNTLEVENGRRTFDLDDTMYLSGRPLHAVTVNLASAVAEEFTGALPLSFAGGVDAFNVAGLLASGVRTATVASDLLKTGGYLRMLQYPQQVDAAFDAVGAGDTADFIRRTAVANGFDGEAADATAAARFNLRRYAQSVRTDWRYQKASFRTDRSKTTRALGTFDCIEAPCVDMCAIDQQVPRYMDAVGRGEVAEAVRIVREDNPLPVILGRVCDHLCENTCVRTHLDQPLAIRQIKRFIMDREAADAEAGTRSRAGEGHQVAIVGAGPAGLAAAEALARLGVAVTIFEARPYAGGMVGGAIPAYRLPEARLEQDLVRLERLGVEIRYGMRAGTDVTIDGLKAHGYEAVFVAIGAQVGRRLGLPGEDAAGILDGITFLREVREGHPPSVGPRVGVIGAGDTAMDCTRTALRLGATSTSLIYRRTVDQMPADREEIHAIREEGVQIVEHARPVALRVVDGHVAGLVCVRTEYRAERDRSGRKVPFDVEGSEFDIELDTLVLAVSQHAALDCFGDALPEVTPSGYVAVDPETLETSIPAVYAGGDVSAHGPASIVRAAADGKRAARAIAARFGIGEDRRDRAEEPFDLAEMQLRRGRRQYRVPVSSTPLQERSGFDETVVGYTPAEASAEAARCLRCDQLCSLCVSVCPNMALLTYEARPMRATLPELVLADGRLVPGSEARYAVDQRYQIALLADLCNECGTCVTACPTAGAPYRDKPRLYVSLEEFEAEESNAFRLLPGPAIEGRFAGATHRLEAGEGLRYTAPGLEAILDAETLALREAQPVGAIEGVAYSLQPAAIMASLLEGLGGSAPYLPTAGGPPGSFVADPLPD